MSCPPLRLARATRLLAMLALAAFVTALAPAQVVRAATIVVDTAADGPGACPGAGCTLRGAIALANAGAGPDTIVFAIGAAGSAQTLFPGSALPEITGPLLIDGWSQGGPGYSGVPLIQLSGTVAGANVDGLRVGAGGANSTIRGLVINRFAGNGVRVAASGVRVQGSWIGLSAGGNADAGNGFAGVLVNGQGTPISGVVIGSDGDGLNDAAERNVIAGNDLYGVNLNSDNSGSVVAGNLIGLDRFGTVAVGNQGAGVVIFTSNNRIGTNGDGVSDDAERNVISGQIAITGQPGDGVYTVSGATNNTIAGNFIGTNIGGDIAVPNNDNGIFLSSGDNLVGTNGDGLNDAAERNVIAGNGVAQIRTFFSAGNVIAGNYICTTSGGTTALAPASSGRGVYIDGGTTGVLVGTDGDGLNDAAERNVISGCRAEGVLLVGASGAHIAGNYIGLAADGAPLGNQGVGVSISNASSGNTVGTNGDGSSGDANERNIISANQGGGLAIDAGLFAGSNNNVVAGNYIGSNAAGTSVAGYANQFGGVAVRGTYNFLSGARIPSVGNRIGTDANGTADALEGNLISGNAVFAIPGVDLSIADNTAVAGNIIGTDPTNTQDWGNGGAGVSLRDGTGNRIGGPDDAQANIIRFNGVSFASAGVVLSTSQADQPTTGNTVERNIISDNRGDGVSSLRTELAPAVAAPGDGPADNTIVNNTIAGNSGHGVFNQGASPAILGNTIIGNGGSGVRSEVSFGVSADPATAADDVLSRPLIGELPDFKNEIVGNCAGGAAGCAGIFSLDTAPANVGTLEQDNFTDANSGASFVSQRWYGAVEILAGGSPSAGSATLASANGGPGYTLGSNSGACAGLGGTILHGPGGVSCVDVTTWAQIEQFVVSPAGARTVYTPQSSAAPAAAYSFDADAATQPTDSGAGFVGEGIATGPLSRYQIMELAAAALAPTATTQAAGGVSGTGATLNGTVNARGSATSVSFEYATVSGGPYTTVAATPANASGSADTGVSAALTGLTPNTTYYFRVVATSAAGTTRGAELSFISNPDLPLATTTAASAVTGAGATLNGTVNARNSTTSISFEYATVSGGPYATVAATPATAAGLADTSASAALTGLAPNTTYYFRVVATSVAGTARGSELSFTTAALPPLAETTVASGVSATGATLNGTVNARNSATSISFEYATVSGGPYTSVAAVPASASGGLDTAASATLAGLEPNTLYYFRVVATSAAGTSTGAELSFVTPAAPPVATTLAASGVSETGATLNGTVNAQNSLTGVSFEYATVSGGPYTSVAATPADASGSANTSVGATLTGLAPNTTYYFRVVADSKPGTSYGAELSFVTSAALPAATTEAASAVTSAGATLNGTVNARNSATSVSFEYATVSGGPYTTVIGTPDVAGGAADTPASAALTGLVPNTTYYFRVVAGNAAGTATGAELSFTTAAVAPTATTLAANGVSATGATLNGTVNAQNSPTQIGFELATASGGPYTAVAAVPNLAGGAADTGTSAALSGLAPNTTYYFRVVASNSAGAATGAELSFTTAAVAPTAATLAATGVISTGATLNGTVNARNSATSISFEYATVSGGPYTTVAASPAAAVGAADTGTSAALSGLTPSTTYYFRVVATSAAGTTRGAELSFTTPAGPAPAHQLFLPLLRADALPDLVVSGLTISPAKTSFSASEPVTVTVTITNRGSAPSVQGFWVDLYANPRGQPAVNQLWHDLCALSPCVGAAWPIARGLAPGDSITVTTRLGFDPRRTYWLDSLPAGTTTLYALVDSWNISGATGAVPEADEGNNWRALGGLSSSGASPAPAARPPAGSPAPRSGGLPVPPRPAP